LSKKTVSLLAALTSLGLLPRSLVLVCDEQGSGVLVHLPIEHVKP